MFWRFCLILCIGVLLEWKITQCAAAEVGKTKEKVRAYEFGFSIEEQQHRHEKRDENGIVMGEFGFITADGIYHVTVYATDENGKFKIISMKNYPYGNPEKKIMIMTIPLVKKPVVTPTMVKAATPDKSCGGCVLPKKFNLLPADVKGKKPSDDAKTAFRPLSKALNDDSSGKSNGGTPIREQGIPKSQSKSSSKPTGLLPPGAVSTGKGNSASQQPLSKPPGSQPLIPPNPPSNSANNKPNGIGSALSKVKPGIPANDGNKYQFKNFNTQTTSTQTPFSTQIPRKNNEKTKYTNSIVGFKNPTNPIRLPDNTANITPQQLINSLRKTTPTQFPTQYFENGQSKTLTPNNPTEIKTRFGFSNQEKQLTTNVGYPPPTRGSQTNNLPSPFMNSNFPSTQNIPTTFSSNAKSTLGLPGYTTTLPTKSTFTKPISQFPGNSETLSINKNSPINTQFGLQKKGSPIDNTNTVPQQLRNFKTKTTPTRPFTTPFAQQNGRYPLTASGGSPTYNINTTPQQLKTTPAPILAQFPGNHESKTLLPETHTRFGFQSQDTPSPQKNGINLPPAGGSRTTKLLNPLTSNVSKISNVYNTEPKNSDSLTGPNNPATPFAFPARTTAQQNGQKPLPNTSTQNTFRPILKSTKEPKSFHTLSKILPDEETRKNTPINQLPLHTPTLKQISPLTRNPVVEQSGRRPPLVTATPKLINTNILTQPPLTGNSLTPKRLQQNTNEARTSTYNTPSTKKLTPDAPSSQSTGKVNSPTNVGGGIGTGVGAGGGGGPLYRFKYVLDYNSHREEGRIDGSKEGKYNTIGEDGIRRIIDYIANENGYQPHIKVQRLPPNELPTGENKLKEYEFVWFN